MRYKKGDYVCYPDVDITGDVYEVIGIWVLDPNKLTMRHLTSDGLKIIHEYPEVLMEPDELCRLRAIVEAHKRLLNNKSVDELIADLEFCDLDFMLESYHASFTDEFKAYKNLTKIIRKINKEIAMALSNNDTKLAKILKRIIKNTGSLTLFDSSLDQSHGK